MMTLKACTRPGSHQDPEGVVQPEAPDQQKRGDESARKEQGDEQDRHQQNAAGQIPLGQRVGGQRADEHAQGGPHQRAQDRVPVGSQHQRVEQQVLIRRWRPVGVGQLEAQHLGLFDALQRNQDQVPERVQHGETEHGHEQHVDPVECMAADPSANGHDSSLPTTAPATIGRSRCSAVPAYWRSART